MDAIRSLCDRCVVMNSGFKTRKAPAGGAWRRKKNSFGTLGDEQLECKISRYFTQHHALDGVQFSDRTREIVVILGAKGRLKARSEAIGGIISAERAVKYTWTVLR